MALRVQALEAYAAAECLLAYAAAPGKEADPALIVQQARAVGKRIAFPRTISAPTLEWIETAPHAEFALGRYGILEPVEGPPLGAIPTASVVLVPGVAFTRSGARLGQGGGYYDRFLAGFPGVSIGLAYECQVAPALPCLEHDHDIDWVVTEDGVYGDSDSMPST